MLAAPALLTSLKFPLFASPKLDGVRALITSQGVLSRSLKRIPNRYIQYKLQDFKVGYDGELIVGSPTSRTCYRDTVSGVMREDGEPDFRFYVFDTFEKFDQPYTKRFHDPYRAALDWPGEFLEHTYITNMDELLEYEQGMLERGYEGIMLRDMYAPYKFGRSTVKEGYLLKLKRFEDAEARVIGFEELMHNGNEAKINALGRTERSSHMENKYGLNMLGALVCAFGRDQQFNIGTGFTEADRKEIWQNREKYRGKVAKYKFFAVGMKDLPRHPVWLGWRDERDK